MIFGYGRVSTVDQNLDLQEDALRQAGCETLFMEKMSGSKLDRPKLNKLLEQVREGDTIVIWRLDRLGRSVPDLIELINTFRDRKVGFRCLTTDIDTETATGRFMYNMFASLAEFERELIRERTLAGLASARARGRVGGRPKGISKKYEEKAMAVKALYNDGNSIQKIMKITGVKSAQTIYRWLQAKGVKIGKEAAQQVLPAF